PGENDGISFTDSSAVIGSIAEPRNVITFAMGLISPTGTSRQFSANIGAQTDTFTDDTDNENSPFPTAVDDIGFTVSSVTGGISVFNVLANDFFDGDLIDPAEVTLTVDVPASHPGVTLNTTTGELFVAPN